MKILITGANGLIGSELLPHLTRTGHTAIRLHRTGTALGPDVARWDPATGRIDQSAIDGADAIVHLAGESIASGRWTTERKRHIHDSRVGPTRALSEHLATQPYKPRVLVVASAIGYYGDRGEVWLKENASPGTGFLAEVCQSWEAAAAPASQAGIRVVHTRFGIILTPYGGALARMLTPFRLGVGGRIGSGDQFWSWIDIADVVGAIHHALTTDDVKGPINVVSPNPVTNREFTKVLSKALHRPGIVPLPAIAVRLMLGEMGKELLLASARVKPAALEASGYQFRHPDLAESLSGLLKR